ncbi:MAG TPA: acetolactate decarboxylase [Solirubrobacteraceae bacterium]|nr:acetolactate decarboxylase [Solirubrobacteraceae bacterium]
MSELEFLGALQVELLRHRDMEPAHPAHPRHQAFQSSTVEALLDGAFDGDLTLDELLEHGDLGLGTLNGLDGELVVVDGQAWKADLACDLVPAPASARTPYAVVVPFSPGARLALEGPLDEAGLEAWLAKPLTEPGRPVAVRIDGRFTRVQVRSVPRQTRPYPPLAEAIAHQHIRELTDVAGTMVGFCFPDALDGIELLGWHLHFASQDRRVGGHVLGCTVAEGVVHVDSVTELHVELPPTVDVHRGTALDQAGLRQLETEQ